MAERMEEYANEIRRKAIQENKELRPKDITVIKILLYTGKEQWKEDIRNKGNKSKLFGRKFNEDIYMVDSYRMDNEKLKKQKGALSIILILDRENDKKKAADKLKESNINKLTEQGKKILRKYINNVILDILDENAKKEIIKKFNEEEESEMLGLAVQINRELAESRREGRLEGKIEGKREGKILGFNNGRIAVAKKLKNMGMNINDISKATGLSKKEVEKL